MLAECELYFSLFHQARSSLSVQRAMSASPGATIYTWRLRSGQRSGSVFSPSKYTLNHRPDAGWHTACLVDILRAESIIVANVIQAHAWGRNLHHLSLRVKSNVTCMTLKSSKGPFIFTLDSKILPQTLNSCIFSPLFRASCKNAQF